MSLLEADYREGCELSGLRLGFFAYGSGSKSKVFEGEVQPRWREVCSRFHLQERLQKRRAIDYPTYEALHRGRRTEPAGPAEGRFRLKEVEEAHAGYLGARSYAWYAPEPASAER